jgi:hypothetical protein
MIHFWQLVIGYVVTGEESGHLFLTHDLVPRDHAVVQHIQSGAHLKNPPLVVDASVFRDLTVKNLTGTAAAGPEGFEPPATWLKARRSTELSYEPTHARRTALLQCEKSI